MRFVLRRRKLKQLVVTLKTGETFRGVLWQKDPEAWVLRAAEVLPPNERPVGVDGELIVLTANIAYAQKP